MLLFSFAIDLKVVLDVVFFRCGRRWYGLYQMCCVALFDHAFGFVGFEM